MELSYKFIHLWTGRYLRETTNADLVPWPGINFASRLLGRSPAVEMQGADFRLGQAARPEEDPFAYEGEFQKETP